MERATFNETMAIVSRFGGDSDFVRTVFYALMSEGHDDLEEIIEAVNRYGELPDDFVEDLSALRGYRQYYGRRISDYTPEQRLMLRAFDGHWTEDLVRRMAGLDVRPPNNAAPAPRVQ